MQGECTGWRRGKELLLLLIEKKRGKREEKREEQWEGEEGEEEGEQGEVCSLDFY